VFASSLSLEKRILISWTTKQLTRLHTTEERRNSFEALTNFHSVDKYNTNFVV